MATQKGLYVLFLVFVYSLGSVSCACTLPTELENSSWNYVERSLVLTFGTDTMAGLNFQARGTTINDFTCISSFNNVIVWKSDTSYTNAGEVRNIYMCMKYTKVSDNLFYFYLLSDKNSDLLTNERVYTPSTPVSDMTCDFCQYTSEPQDSEVHTLQKQGTSETLPSGVSACLPCEEVCPLTTPTTTPSITPRSCAEGNGTCIYPSVGCTTSVLPIRCGCGKICCKKP